MLDWQAMPAHELEAHYNPRVAVKDAQAAIDKLTADSAQASRLLAGNCHFESDCRFGPGPLETLDLYRPKDQKASAPLAIFVHGGYWRALDKSDHTLVVPPLLAAGAVVANVNYDLCPAVTLDEIAAQMVRAVRYCHRHASQWGADPARLVLIGHSAGAHLAARVLNTPADADGTPADLVSGVAAISGIYEPLIATKLSVNEQAQISEQMALSNDCLRNAPLGNAAVVAWAGGDEPMGWIEQSVRYSQTVSGAGLACRQFVLPDTNHFTVLEQSMQPDSLGFKAIVELLGC